MFPVFVAGGEARAQVGSLQAAAVADGHVCIGHLAHLVRDVQAGVAPYDVGSKDRHSSRCGLGGFRGGGRCRRCDRR